MQINKHEVPIHHQYLNFPVKDGAAMRKVRFRVGDQVVRYFDIEWAESEPDFWVITDVSEFKGKSLVIEIDEAEKKDQTEGAASSTEYPESLAAFIHSDTLEGDENLYQEKYRPQFHFSSRRGWINDPNGLAYYKGTYHLFYQHNPFGRQWGNMHWGRAVSKNLVQWEEFSDTFYPDAQGTMFSGSAVVDWENTSGLKSGSQYPLICIYTAAGEFAEPKVPYTQCLAFSSDGGLTWQKFKDNPVFPPIAEGTRDPKVIWHQNSQQWIMALYIGRKKDSSSNIHHFALFSSQNLKQWHPLQDLYFPGTGECPEFFPLPLDGDSGQLKWIYWVADGYYLIGQFDENKFTPETEILQSTYSTVKHDDAAGLVFRGGYAAQTWSDIPDEDGRRIQIAWLTGDIPGMPFNQQMTFPVELTLKSTINGPRLHSWPVKEIALLYQEEKHLRDIQISDRITILPTDDHVLLDIQAVIDVGDADEIEFNFRGISLIYNVHKQEVSCLEKTTQLKTQNGTLQIRILLDLASIEIFAEDGLVYLPFSAVPEDQNITCFLQAKGGPGLAKNITIIKLGSSWK